MSALYSMNRSGVGVETSVSSPFELADVETTTLAGLTTAAGAAGATLAAGSTGPFAGAEYSASSFSAVKIICRTRPI